jgi:hypothetical protein
VDASRNRDVNGTRSRAFVVFSFTSVGNAPGMRIRRHHGDEKQDQGRAVEPPAWQASKPEWGVVSIDAPKAVDLRTPERAA